VVAARGALSILAIATVAVLLSGGGERPESPGNRRNPRRSNLPVVGGRKTRRGVAQGWDIRASATFCSGLILSAVLTVAAASGGVLRGAILLAVYGALLFLMAPFRNHLDLGSRRCWLRRGEVAFDRFRLHTAHLISRVMFVLLGVLFIAYEGTSALSALYESNGATDLAFAAEQWGNNVVRGVLGVAMIAALAAFLVVVLPRKLLRHRGSKDLSSSREEAYTAKRGGDV